MNRRELLTLVTSLARQADGYDTDEVSRAQLDALNYYFMRPRGDEVAGRSQVVSGDLSAMVEANAAQMMEAFTGKNICQLDAIGKADEEQAQLESDACTYVIMRQNNGYLMFIEAIKDALLQRNAIGKCWVEERTHTRIREYENVAPEAYAEIALSSEVIEWKPRKGYLRVRQRETTRKLRVKSVPVENYLYTANWGSLDLSRIPFQAERHCDLRSELKERFPKKAAAIERLAAFKTTSENQSARNPRGRQQITNPTRDRSLDEIEWLEALVYVDMDGDGIAELYSVAFVESKLLLDDYEVSGVNFCAGSALVNPHRFLGISLYDKLKQTQDINTGLTRGLLDNINANNKSRTAYHERKVDAQALADGSMSTNVPVKGVDDVRKALFPFSQPDMSAGILQNIEAQKRTRAELGGAALDMAQANMQLPDRAGSQGIDRAYSVMEQLAGMMMRTVAESFARNLYLLVHEMLRHNFKGPLTFMQGKEWVTTDPSEWRRREAVTVNLGMSAGQRERRRNALAFVLQSQLTLADKGYNKILVNLEGFYNALTDWCEVAELENSDKYWLDPRTPESQKALKDVQDKAEQARAAQQKLTDLALGLEQLRIALEKYGGDAERALKWRVEQLHAAVSEMQVVGKATENLELQRNERADVDAKAESDASMLAQVSELVAELKELGSGKANGAAKE